MANTQSLCTSFLGDLLVGRHNFGTGPVRATSAADTFKVSLYLTTATVDASTTQYTSTGEVSGTGYVAGGATLTNTVAPATTNTSSTAGVAYWTPSAAVAYTDVTLATPFDAALIYNQTQANRSVAVYTFGAQVITAGTFVLVMPPNNAATGLLRLNTT